MRPPWMSPQSTIFYLATGGITGFITGALGAPTWLIIVLTFSMGIALTNGTTEPRKKGKGP